MAKRRRADVPWWGLVSSAAAPVLLIGGWTLAGHRQRPDFDPVTETISALAARGADDRWIMTAALTGLGLCHLTTAAALHQARLPGRVLLALGGAATLGVAAFPLPATDDGSVAHTVAAGIAFVSLAVWPAAAARHQAPVVLTPLVAVPAAAVLSSLVFWFATGLVVPGAPLGLAERTAAGAQALWPGAVAWGARRWRP